MLSLKSGAFFNKKALSSKTGSVIGASGLSYDDDGNNDGMQSKLTVSVR
jgi:hypothetical protein